MSFMIAFGLASIMLCLGMILRTKVTLFKNMLIPASVLAGVLGLISMNTGLVQQTDASMFGTIVTYLFTITFISIGLTGSSKKDKKGTSSNSKEIVKGSIGLGFIWNILYAITPVVGVIVLLLIGGLFGMSPLYGLMVPFSFAQGPGQAATFGGILEQEYGIENAAMVGLTFAVIGFLVCFLIGVPLAKYGLRKGLAKNFNRGNVDGFVKRGYYTREEKSDSVGQETIYSGNMDTMTFHFAIIGISFLIALVVTELVSYIPGIGSTLGGLMFIYGMLAAYLVKYAMRKLNIDHLLDNTFQTKITGWATDYLIVASFMAVQFSVIGEWIVPILIGSAIIVLVSFVIVFYFGKRLGGENDFERTLGLFGAATGTVPSGIALVRIVDPSLKTNTAVELGLMNVPMMLHPITVSTIFLIASDIVSLGVGLLLLLAPVPIYLIVLKVFKVWGKKTYDLKDKTDESTTKVEAFPRAK